MRQITLAMAIFVSLSAAASAQTVSSKTTQSTEAGNNNYAYVFAAPGVTAPGGIGTLHVGVGAEGFYKNGAGGSFELGYLSDIKEFKGGLGHFSLNGSYHFLKSGNGKTVPFITGGYTGFFRSFYANGVNFGGGVNYWFKEKVGLRVEFRDNVLIENGTAHFLDFRVGFAFR
jgi:hypothetical protein